MVNAKFSGNVDVNHYQLLNLLLHMVSGAPTTPVEGQIWYDSATHRLKFRDNAGADIDPAARANHTGTQLASTISDLAATVQAYRLDQFAAPSADVSLASHKITNLTSGSTNSDAVNVGQLNSAISGALAGTTWKDPARVATAANIATLAGGAPNTVDGISLAVNDRILVKNQTTQSQNGIYTVATLGTGSNGTWSRATDMAVAAVVQGGTLIAIDEGTSQADTAWMVSADVAAVGTNSMSWIPFGVGQVYTAGAGLTLTGSSFDVGQGSGIIVAADSISLDTAVALTKKKVGYVPTTGTDLTINHAFALSDKHDLIAKVYEVGTPSIEVQCGVSPQDANNVVLSFGTTPTSNQYRYSMIGLS